MRLKTRVVTILLFCCLLIVIMLFYFIIFLEDLQSFSPKEIKKNPLIIVPFAEIRTKNETKSESTMASIIMRKVESKLKSLNFSKLFNETDKLRMNSIVESLKNDLLLPEELPEESAWKIASSWVRAREIIPENAPLLGYVMNALQKSRITHADVTTKGTQLKLMLELEDGQQVLFKPMRYSRDLVISGIYSGADRHNGEIVAFHISRLLNMRYVPIVASRLIDVAKEIKEVASSALLATFVTKTNQSKHCFYGECYYCSELDPVCPDENGILEGAIINLLPSKYQLQKLRNPWQRTYKDGVKALWEQDINYCSSVFKKLPLRPRILDLIDVSIFDYLIGNADRHHYEVFKDVSNSALLFLDNGKSFGDPFHHEITILYPLYQCCIVRNTTYQRLKLISSIRISDAIEYILSNDIISPLITKSHLLALDERIKTIIAIIHICFDTKGRHEVLK